MLCFIAQSCPSLCNPMDCSPQGSSIHGILRASILEWVTICYSRRSSKPGIEPRSPALRADCRPSEPPGKPFAILLTSKKRNKCPQAKNPTPSSPSPCRSSISMMENVFVIRAGHKGKLCLGPMVGTGEMCRSHPLFTPSVTTCTTHLKELASQRGRCRRWAHLQCGVTAPHSQGLLGKQFLKSRGGEPSRFGSP